MALIKCPNCGKEYSEHAEKCPKCGMTLQEAEQKVKQSKENAKPRKGFKAFGKILVFVAIAAILGVGVFYYINHQGGNINSDSTVELNDIFYEEGNVNTDGTLSNGTEFETEAEFDTEDNSSSDEVLDYDEIEARIETILAKSPVDASNSKRTAKVLVLKSNGTVFPYLCEDDDYYYYSIQEFNYCKKSDARVETYRAEDGKGVLCSNAEEDIPVYSDADTSSEVLFNMSSNYGFPEPYDCLGYSDGWYKVRDIETDKEGYVKDIDDIEWLSVYID